MNRRVTPLRITQSKKESKAGTDEIKGHADKMIGWNKQYGLELVLWGMEMRVENGNR